MVVGEDIKDARHAPQEPGGGQQSGDDPALQLTHGACVGRGPGGSVTGKSTPGGAFSI